MTNNRFTDNINSDTNLPATVAATMTDQSPISDDEVSTERSASAPHAGHGMDLVDTRAPLDNVAGGPVPNMDASWFSSPRSGNGVEGFKWGQEITIPVSVDQEHPIDAQHAEKKSNATQSMYFSPSAIQEDFVAAPDPTDCGGISASEVLSGGHADYVFTSEQVILAHSRVLQTGILDKLAVWRSADTPVTGARTRPSLISDRAILVGLLLLASEHGNFRISSLAVVFQNRLPPESRALLHLSGVAPVSLDDTREDKRWYGRTHRAFHRMLALMDPFPRDQVATITSAEVPAALDAHDSDRERKSVV